MSNSTNVNGGVIITVPANSTWNGSVSLSATLAVAIGGAAVTSYPSITVLGAGGAWTNGDTVLGMALAVPAVGASALTGAIAHGDQVLPNVRVQTRENPVSLILNIGPGVVGTASAIGEMQ